MTIVFSYLRLILFIGGLLVGVQVPGFVDQYGKSLEAHFLESGKSLSEFQKDAQTYFNGDMDKLIAHYRDTQDPVIRDGGKSILSIYRRYTELKSALAKFQQGYWRAYLQAIFDPVADVQQEVRANFSYTIKLDATAILFGLAVGLITSLICEAFVRATLGAAVMLRHRSRSTT